MVVFGLMVGLDDLRGLFQPLILWFYDSGVKWIGCIFLPIWTALKSGLMKKAVSVNLSVDFS